MNLSNLAHTHKDFGSEELLERILKDEEEHIDWIEAQLDRLTKGHPKLPRTTDCC